MLLAQLDESRQWTHFARVQVEGFGDEESSLARRLFGVLIVTWNTLASAFKNLAIICIYLSVELLLGHQNAFQVIGIVVLEVNDSAAGLPKTALDGKVDVFVAAKRLVL